MDNKELATKKLEDLKKKITPYIQNYGTNGVHGVGISGSAVVVFYTENQSAAQTEALAEITKIGDGRVKFVESDVPRLA